MKETGIVRIFDDLGRIVVEKEEEIHDSYGDLLKWLQSEAE